jgi:hypothetical protein
MQSEIGHAIAHETPFKHFIHAGKILPPDHLKKHNFKSRIPEQSPSWKMIRNFKKKCQMEAMSRRHRIKNSKKPARLSAVLNQTSFV